MADLDVDVLVVGWGKGGKTLAATLGRAGRRVAVVERSPAMYGGSCININCIPTKILVHQAEQRPPADDPARWFATSVARRDDLTARLRAANHAMLADLDTVTLVDGRARFTGPRSVEVTGGDDRLTIEADTVVVNTGTVPACPPVDGADTSSRVFDSTSVQHIDPLPAHLLVVGGGYVGLEFAGMFAGFGSKVTLVNRGETLLPDQDRDVADEVAAVLEGQGVDLLLGSEVASVRDTEAGDQAVATLSGSGAGELTVDAVLPATGRRPATDDLGLDAAGIDVDDHGYVVADERRRTSAPGVYAVGDVNGGPQFTYISLDDHRIVLDQLTGSGRRTTADRVAVPSTIFLTPPLARVGLDETSARRAGRPYRVATKQVTDIAAMPRPKIVGNPQGLIKVLVDPETDLVLGATLFCEGAQDLVNLVALAMRSRTTASDLRDGIWTHPSIAEGLNEVLAALQ